MSRPMITMNIEIRLLQKIRPDPPEPLNKYGLPHHVDADMRDAVHFSSQTDFIECGKVMSRFHDLAEEIRREQEAARAQP